MTYDEYKEKYGDNPPKMSYDELVYARVKAYNDEVGTLGLLDCPKCKNKGHIMYIRKGGFEDGLEEFIQECDCMAQRRALHRAKSSGLGQYLNKGLQDFTVDEPFQDKMFKKAVEFIGNEKGNWFAMLGQSGCGKTLICSIVSNELLKSGRDVMYITWTDFIATIKRDLMSDKADDVSHYIQQVKSVEVLFVDELLKKYNETDLKYIIEIINYRYTNNLTTIITSEKHINELLDIDEATFSRVVEKCEHFIVDTNNDRTKNYRIKHLLK